MSYRGAGTVFGPLHFNAHASPGVSASAEGRIYFDSGTNTFLVSENGGAYVPLGTATTGGGWTDDGTVVRLTTVTDGVGIGTATPAASSKLEVLGDATRKNVFLTGGAAAGAALGGSLVFTAGAGGPTGAGGIVGLTGGPGGATSGNAGGVTILGGTATNGDGGAITISGSAGLGTDRNGGSVTITSGSSTGTGDGGTSTVTGGAAAASTGTAGRAIVRGGAGFGTGSGASGTILGGVGGATGAGGDGRVIGGNGGATSGAAGGVLLQGGSPVDGNGGSVTVIGSNGVGTNRSGGSVLLTAGTATGTGSGGILSLVSGTSPTGTTGAITFSTGTTGVAAERGRFSGIGTLFTGDGTLASGFGGSGAATTALHAYRDNTTSVRVAAFSAAALANSSYLILERARGTAASPAAVTSGDVIGGISFQGATTTTDTRTFVDLVAEADGTPGSVNDAPGRLRILVTPDNSGTPVECLRINNVGELFLGDGTAASAIIAPFTGQALLAYRNERCFASLYTFSATATDSGILSFARGRGTAASPAIVANGDTVGEIQFAAFDSPTTGRIAASILVAVDGTPGVADMPGRLVVRTTPDGTDVPVERMRINNAGTVFIGNGTLATTYGGGGASFVPLLMYNGDASGANQYIRSFNTTVGSGSSLVLDRARGTPAVPAAVNSGDNLGGLYFAGASSPTTTNYTGLIASFASTAGATSGDLRFSTSSASALVERARITDAGVLQVGDGTLNAAYVVTSPGHAQFYGNTSNSVSSESYSAAATAAGSWTLKRGRGTPASPSTVVQNDALGYVTFQGTVDAGIGILNNFANIAAFVDGATVANGDAPGRLVFSTTPDGSGTLAERMRIDNAGNVGIAVTPTSRLDVNASVGLGNIQTISATTTLDDTDAVVLVNASGGAVTVNLPAAAGVTRRSYVIKKTDSSGNVVTVDASGAETIDGTTTRTLASQFDSLTIVCDGTAWFIV